MRTEAENSCISRELLIIRDCYVLYQSKNVTEKQRGRMKRPANTTKLKRTELARQVGLASSEAQTKVKPPQQPIGHLICHQEQAEVVHF